MDTRARIIPASRWWRIYISPTMGAGAGYLGSLYSNCRGNTVGRLRGIGIYRRIMRPRIAIIIRLLLARAGFHRLFTYVFLIDDKDGKRKTVITVPSLLYECGHNF